MPVNVISNQSGVFTHSHIDKTVTYTINRANIRQIDVLYHVS